MERLKMNIAETTKVFCELNQLGSSEDVNYKDQIEQSATKYTLYSTKKGKHEGFVFSDNSVLQLSYFDDIILTNILDKNELFLHFPKIKLIVDKSKDNDND